MQRAPFQLAGAACALQRLDSPFLGGADLLHAYDGLVLRDLEEHGCTQQRVAPAFCERLVQATPDLVVVGNYTVRQQNERAHALLARR